MQSDFYNLQLYPLQDSALRVLNQRSEFYLTGGTAVGRFHFGHRYSDDLDFFLNNSDHFHQECENVITLLKAEFSKVDTSLFDEAFVRLFITQGDTSLKVELINDVGYHYGDFVNFPQYYRVDNIRNILSNKLTALTRKAAKDLSDIIVICRNLNFTWPEIFEEAQRKDTWVNVLGTVKLLGEANVEELATEVNWKT